MLFSPRKRRCFLCWWWIFYWMRVFSAQAEVFLGWSLIIYAFLCFLRASGGVSSGVEPSADNLLFSPRKRRCFQRNRNYRHHREVFSAQAEVFPQPSHKVSVLTGFLRASGGVSTRDDVCTPVRKFSPRKRRCFFLARSVPACW